MLTNLHPYRALFAMAFVTMAAIFITLSHSTVRHVGAVLLLMQLGALLLPRIELPKPWGGLRLRA